MTKNKLKIIILNHRKRCKIIILNLICSNLVHVHEIIIIFLIVNPVCKAKENQQLLTSNQTKLTLI